jgi:hypothetical protein
MKKTAELLVGAFLAAGLLTAGLGCRLGGSGTPPEDAVFAFGGWSAGGNFDVRLKKFDKDGTEDTVSWDKLLSDSADYSESNVMAIDSAGSVYVGYYRSGGASGYDWRIRKFSAAGVEDTTNWNKTLDGDMNGGHDTLTALVIDSNDDLYAVGYCRDGVNTNLMDWRIRKFASGGAEITAGWNKAVSGDAAISMDLPYAAAVDSDDNLYVTGVLYTLSGRAQVIKKYSSAGVEDTANWNKSDTNLALEYRCLAVDSSDNLYLGGRGSDGLFMVKKFSSAGVEDTVNWDKSFSIETPSWITAMAVDSEDNLYAAGRFSNGMDSGWCLKKFTSGGTEITTGWDKQLDVAGQEDIVHSMAAGGLDDLYVFGVVWDGDTSTYSWAIRKYAPDGTEDTVNWNKELPAEDLDSGNGLSIVVVF